MSNILEPHLVCEAVKAKLTANISEFTFDDKTIASDSIKIISSIPTDGKYGLKPPWMGVYYTYDDDGVVAASGHSMKVPITVGVLCCSTPGKKTDNEAVREAMYYAKKTLSIWSNDDSLIDEYLINIGTIETPENVFVDLEAKPQPIKIIPNPTAEIALVTSWFQYLETH